MTRRSKPSGNTPTPSPNSQTVSQSKQNHGASLISPTPQVNRPSVLETSVPSQIKDAMPAPPRTQEQDLRLHPLWHAVQTLPEDLQVFLSQDYTLKKVEIKKMEYYRVLLHFNPATKARFCHLKVDLEHGFEEELLPRLKPFISSHPSSPSPMDEEHNHRDFDPMSASTTRRMLQNFLKSRVPTVKVPTHTSLSGLRLLYKQHIDTDLPVAREPHFTRTPRILKLSALKGQTIQHLQFALQCHAPEVFIHTMGMTRPVCLALYNKFLLEGIVEPGSLIEGLHYSIITDLES